MDGDFTPLDSPSSSKKEKRGHNHENAASTLFVSSLPYDATSTDLITHFSFVGPIRHGFVATDKETGKSKGVGYVTYSLKEDADRALQELDGSEFGGKGRKIRVALADRKPGREILQARDAERAERATKKPRVTAVEEESGPHDPNAIRTLVVTGLPDDLTKAVLWKKVRKVDDRAEIEYPIEGEPNSAHIVFPTHGDALNGLPKLHGHTYKGAIMSAVLKKRLEKLSAKGEGRAPSHAGRLIVRNLAWDTTEADLRATFLKFGPIQAIDLPTAPSKLPTEEGKPAPPPRARGFAFVWFMVKKDAERAMEAVNGKPIIRAIDAGQRTGPGKGKKIPLGEGRPVAVDWALSKDKWQENKKEEPEEKDESGSESGSSDSGSGSDSDGSHSDSDGESDEESGSDEEDVDMEEGSDAEEEEEEKVEEAPVKPKLPDTDVGSTLFIRNVPFETTEHELGTLFRSFGPIRYARITMDKVTGRSRGSGFVCFWNKEHADDAIAESERVSQETGANAMPLGDKKNPFALPSVLTIDPSSSLASRLVIHGRSLAVTRAVTREIAGNLKEDAEHARQQNDKRNTYLMREGVVFPNSPAASALPEAEIEKRQAAFNARKTLLRSNPSLYISKTRLSVRQLPLFVTDRGLKRLAIYAVREFDAEVTAGTREALTRMEENDNTLSPALEGKKPKRGERQTAVVQSKVVRQTEKIDPLTGQGRSKGYGFIEARSHKEALKFLRWANNNAAVGPLLWEWWTAELAEIRDRTEKALKAARAGEGKEKEKETVEDLEARLKKLESRVAEGDDRSGGGMRAGKTLLIEFSIENVQVVRRRVDKMSATREGGREREGGSKRKAAEDSDDEGAPAGGDRGKRQRFSKDKDGKDGRRDRKDRGGKDRDGKRSDRRERKGDKEEKRDRRRGGPEGPSGANTTEPEKKGLENLGNKLGSMIGRKRKMRRAGK